MSIVAKSRRPRFTNIHLGFIVDQCFARVPGGTARYTRELGAALARTSGPRDQVTGWCGWSADLSPGAIDGMLGPHRLALPRVALARAWAAGAGPVPRNCDVVHAPTLLAPPRRRRPLVVTIHDAVPWTHPETLTAHGGDWHRTMARRAQRADAIVVPTRAVADALGSVISPRRIEVVALGPTEALLIAPADAGARRASLALPAEYAIVVATAEPRKGLDVALDAWAESSPLPLAVVGPRGWGEFDLSAEVKRRGLSSAVLPLGQLDDVDLAAALHGATMMVAPSRAEGFGLPVLEAMAAGIPVVLSDDPAQVEVAGGSGVVVPIGDASALAAAVAHLYASPEARAAGSTGGLARAKAFSWDGAATSLWALYRELASQ